MENWKSLNAKSIFLQHSIDLQYCDCLYKMWKQVKDRKNDRIHVQKSYSIILADEKMAVGSGGVRASVQLESLNL